MSKGSAVAIGIFDGVHVGHKAIIERCVKKAKRLHLKSMVLTFYPHPLKVISPKQAPLLVSSLSHRLSLIKKIGIDEVMVIHFNKSFLRLTPAEFVRKILVDKLQAKEVFVGENFRFGRGRRAGARQLSALGRRDGFNVNIIRSIRKKDRVVSSSLIRSLITKGALEDAETLLGRPVSILGSVVKGLSRGRQLGYPTANVDPHHEAIPPSGIYAVKVRLKDKSYGGVLYIGKCPTFKDLEHLKEPRIEVHILGFKGSLYGKDIEIHFVKRIRGDKKFRTKELLKNQIALDEAIARKLLKYA